MIQPYQELEEKYAEFAGTDYAVSVNTGTAALHLALLAMGVGKGDEVIVPEFTMIACAWAVTYTGAKPVFVDCGDDLLIDVSKIEAKITKKTKAIMPVHIYGRVCDMTEIIKLANKYNLRVLEDCCEAQGATFRGKKVGSFDVGVVSFYWNKIIPAEEGGMITTNDKDIVKIANLLKNMSFTKEHNYYHPMIGFNYRMSNAQAKIALSNLENAEKLIEKRRLIESWYDEMIPKCMQMPERKAVWVYDCKHPMAEELVKKLNSQGINARIGFKPMSQQPMYERRFTNLKAFEKSLEVFYLPVNPNMTKADIAKICQKIDTYTRVL